MVDPIVKWAGGKRALLPELIKYLPTNHKDLHYLEPFVGGGALGLYVAEHDLFKSYEFSDKNEHLMRLYLEVNVNLYSDLIWQLQYLEKNYNALLNTESKEAFYYNCRDIFNQEGDPHYFMFLNRCGFNGLYRENFSGEFNVPWGHKQTISLVGDKSLANLRDVSNLLTAKDIELWTGDFDTPHVPLNPDYFYYLDPPYEPLTSNFSYVADDNKNSMLSRLSSFCDELTRKGHKFLLSNSYTEATMNCFNKYKLKDIIEAPRRISCKADGREPVREILVTNY